MQSLNTQKKMREIILVFFFFFFFVRFCFQVEKVERDLNSIHLWQELGKSIIVSMVRTYSL